MPGKLEHAEVITPVQRRRPFVGEEGGDHSGDLRTGYVGLAGRAVTGIAPNQLFTGGRWASGTLSAVGAGEEVVAASEYRALRQQVREFQAAARKKTLENEILRQVLI